MCLRLCPGESTVVPPLLGIPHMASVALQLVPSSALDITIITPVALASNGPWMDVLLGSSPVTLLFSSEHLGIQC